MKLNKVFIVLLVVLSMLSQSMVCFAQADSDGTEITGWSFYALNCDATVNLVSDEAASGNNSLHIVNRTPENGDQNYFRANTVVTLPKAGRYKFGCSVKTKNACKNGGRARMFMKSYFASIVPFAKSSNWQKFEFIYDAESSMTEWLGFMISDQCDDIWIDDVFMYQLDDNNQPIGANLVPNPSFEENTAKGSATTDSSNNEYYYYNDDLNSVSGFLARSKNIPVSYKDGIQIDGSNEEWDGITLIHMSGRSTLESYSGAEMKNDAQIRYAYDEKNFYVLMEVDDPVHFDKGDYYWRSDSAQIMVGTKPGEFGTEIGIMHQEDGTTYQTHDDIKISTGRIGNKTIYEAAFEWGKYIPSSPSSFSFNAIVNNNDGTGREYSLEIAPGISNVKSAADSPILTFLPKGQSYYNVLSTEASTATSGDVQNCALTILNWGADKDFTVEMPTENIEKTLNVKQNAVESIPFSHKFEGIGNVSLNATVNGEDVEKTVDVYPDNEVFNKMVAEFGEDLKKIEDLMEQCNQKGITTEYERTDKALMERAIEVTTDKMQEGDLAIVLYNLQAIRKVIDEDIANLNGYLSGEKKEKVVTNYVTSPITMKGKSFYAQTETKGVVEERPVFLIGYNTGWEGRDERSDWPDFGINLYSEGYMFDEIIGKNGYPVGWNDMGVSANGKADSDIEVIPGAGVNGSNALKITTRSTESKDSKASLLYSYYTLKPNTTYHYGYKIKGNVKGNMWIGIESPHETNGDFKNWQSFDYTFTTGADETRNQILIHLPDASEVYIDDVYIYEGDSKENGVTSPGFEEYYEPIEGTPYGANRTLLNKFQENLARDEYNNVAVMLDITLHSVPGVLWETTDFHHTGGFLSWEVDNDKIFEVIRIYLEQILPIAKEYGCTFSIQLHNEPVLMAYQYDYYIPHWQKYLKEKYATIDDLNAAYGSNYEKFEDVLMPSEYSESRYHYDYRVFAEGLAAEYFQKLYDIAKEIDPDIYVTNKYMMDLNVWENSGQFTSNPITRGINFDLLYKSSDIPGSDPAAYPQYAQNTLQAKMQWYDYQSDIAGKPVFDMEDHIIVDGSNMDYSDRVPIWYNANIWQGAMHGMSADMIWLWGRSDHLENGTFNNTTIQYRADLMHMTSKIGYDLNRLGKEVEAIRNRKADVAMLYSHTTRSYDSFYLNSLYNAYTATLYNGVKPFYLIEDQAERLQEFDTLIVPEASHVKRKVFDEVLKFVRNGGKVVMIGEDCLSYDESNQPMPQDALEEIRKSATVIEANSVHGEYFSAVKDTVGKDLEKIFRDNGKIKVELKDADTGAKIENTEISWAEYDGGYVLNLCNYDWGKVKNAVIEIDGKKVEAMTDLIELEEWGDTVELSPYTPVMVKVAK